MKAPLQPQYIPIAQRGPTPDAASGAECAGDVRDVGGEDAGGAGDRSPAVAASEGVGVAAAGGMEDVRIVRRNGRKAVSRRVERRRPAPLRGGGSRPSAPWRSRIADLTGS